MACVDETPKKIVESKLFCFLCGCTLNKERVCEHSRPNQSRDRCGRDCFFVEWNIHLHSKLLQTFNSLWKNFYLPLYLKKKKDYDNGGSGIRTKRLRKETTCLEAYMDPRTSVISLPEFRRTEYFRYTANWWDPYGGSKPWSCLNQAEQWHIQHATQSTDLRVKG